MSEHEALYVALEKEKRALEEKLSTVKDEMRVLEEQILNRWADLAQTSAKFDGMTVYVAKDFVCNKRAGVPTEAVVEALQVAGLENLVHPDYSASSLKAAIKDLRGEEGDDSQVPEALKAVVDYRELFRLRVRAS